MELTYTKRLTPLITAIRARRSVPATFTWRNADSGCEEVSFITCTRAAKWTTVFTPANAPDQSVSAPIDFIWTTSTPVGRPAACSADLTVPHTCQPFNATLLHSALPTKPLAPVTNIFILWPF